MKKIFFIFIQLMTVLGYSQIAAGSSKLPVNPYQKHAWEFERYINENQEQKISKEPGDSIEIHRNTQPQLDGTVTWTISLPSGHGSVTRMQCAIFMIEFNPNEYHMVYMKEFSTAQPSFTSFTFVTGGKYQFSVFAEFADGFYTYSPSDFFTINDDASHTSLTEKIDQVVAANTGETKWETALMLHDWITNNVYYDPTTSYYGADMILRGYGLCDGYSKAYMMMLEKAGIPAERCVGEVVDGGENVLHGWNIIFLDGRWYYVDPTWDDPVDTKNPTKKVTGFENHLFFCLDEWSMSLAHKKLNYIEGINTYNIETPNSLEKNYYIINEG